MKKFHTRYLETKDISALLDLEQSKWDSHQAADAATLHQRINAYPELCIGTFCMRTGKALASLFMRPINPALFIAPTRWDITANLPHTTGIHDQSRSLFGISLSSNSADAVNEIFRFFYPRALKAGWRDIYLGSPIPGYQNALQKNPELTAWEYVHKKKKYCNREPFDAQLGYYYKKGFRRIVSIQANYFPHDQSMNYGVILHGVIPFSAPKKLWQSMPFPVIKSLSSVVFGLT
jgi:hypothetical protein